MATIYNNSEITLSTEAQNVVNNSCANYGVDECHVKQYSHEVYTIFDVFANDDYTDYLFSIDTNSKDGTVAYNRY